MTYSFCQGNPYEIENKAFTEKVVNALKNGFSKVRVEHQEYKDGVKRVHAVFVDDRVHIEFLWRTGLYGPNRGLKIKVCGNYGTCREQSFGAGRDGWSKDAAANIVKKVGKDLVTLAEEVQNRENAELSRKNRETLLAKARKQVADAGYNIAHCYFSCSAPNDVSIDIGKINLNQFMQLAESLVAAGVIERK